MPSRALILLLGAFLPFAACTKKEKKPEALALSEDTDAARAHDGGAAPPTASPRAARVVAHLRQPTDLAADGNALFVVDVDPLDDEGASDIVRISLPDGRAERLATKQSGGQALVVVGSDLVWLVAGDVDKGVPDSVVRMPKSGGTPARIATTFFIGDAAIATRDGAIYFHGPSADKGGGALMKKAASDSRGATTLARIDQDVQRQALAVDRANVYWLTTGAIQKTSIEGGRSMKLADATQVRGMVSDGRHLYWTEAGDGGARAGRVRRVAVEGGSVETLLDKVTRPWGIAVDDDAVYWVTNDDSDGAVYRWAKRGSSATRLVGGQGAPVRIVVDGASLYWTNAGDGNVMTTTK